MPVVKVEYDDAVVSEAQAQAFCAIAKKIVVKESGIEEVFVYGNSSHIKVNVAPIEIWVEISDHKVVNAEALAKSIRQGLSAWKSEINFPHLINLTLIPMRWNLELDI